jgi:hypothetical protein
LESIEDELMIVMKKRSKKGENIITADDRILYTYQANASNLTRNISPRRRSHANNHRHMLPCPHLKPS